MNGIPDSAATGQATRLNYYDHQLTKSVVNSARFCDAALLVGTGWPVGDAGWMQIPEGIAVIRKHCPAK